MKKITVTREQQDAINGYRQIGKDLDHLINLKQSFNQHALNAWARPVLQMTSDQIAVAWLGVAEVEPEPVQPWEALKALWEGKRIKAVTKDGFEHISRPEGFKATATWFNPKEAESLGVKYYILEEDTHDA